MVSQVVMIWPGVSRKRLGGCRRTATEGANERALTVPRTRIVRRVIVVAARQLSRPFVLATLRALRLDSLLTGGGRLATVERCWSPS
jgi:hypothetical protein